MINNEDSNVLSVFDTHFAAEEALTSLHKSGFDMQKLSIVGKGYQTEEHPIGFYTAGDRIKTWGGIGAAWGGLWGMLFAPAVFFIPGLGLVALAGPIVTTLVAALESAAVMGGLSALGAALISMGLNEEEAVKYEKDLIAEKYLLIFHGTEAEISQARTTLNNVTTDNAD